MPTAAAIVARQVGRPTEARSAIRRRGGRMRSTHANARARWTAAAVRVRGPSVVAGEEMARAAMTRMPRILLGEWHFERRSTPTPSSRRRTSLISTRVLRLPETIVTMMLELLVKLFTAALPQSPVVPLPLQNENIYI
jgi:hypothetical protein